MADKIHYGIDNPHPLFNRKTELVWDGKYDEYGRRPEVDIAGCAMPLQKIEMIDEPRSNATAQGQLELFEKAHAKAQRRKESESGDATSSLCASASLREETPFRNRLIWGDNKLVMASLLAEFKGKVDLIYIDPPFARPPANPRYSLPPPRSARISRWTCRSATGRKPSAKTNRPWRWSPTATCGAKAPTPICT